MKCFAILEGGGVKGGALAGALAAAEGIDIEFLGFGGTSAGSIVALLAAVGYSGEEIGDELKELDFLTFLDDQGKALNEIFKAKEIIAEQIQGGWWNKFSAARAIKKLLSTYWSSLGLYDGDRLENTLFDLAKKKIPAFTRGTTFEQLSSLSCKPLKVVASNLTKHEPQIFSRELTPQVPVIDAVRASASYPFVFKPYYHLNKHVIDGGISSNLPSFLYQDEYRLYGIRSIAFNLVQGSNNRAVASNLFEFTIDMLDTALEASDHLLFDLSEGVWRVPVKTPANINTLNFYIDRPARENLYAQGFSSGADYFNKHPRFEHLRDAGSKLKHQMIALHGAASLYETILSALVREVEISTRAQDVRACIMLPTDRDSLMVTYEVGFENAPDSDLELSEHEGAAWKVWKENKIITVDLENMRNEPGKYNMPAEKVSRIPIDRKSLICAPIPCGLTSEHDANFKHSLGVVGIDCATKLAETAWLEPGNNKLRIPDIIMGWSRVISRVIRSSLI